MQNPSPRLIIEYLPLGSLDKLGRVTYEESLAVLCQSLDALTSVHEHGIVHRDITPANILIQSRNPLQIKLSDFGLSKATIDLHTLCGTPRYKAPEMYTTRPGEYYTQACDIWSLGVVVYELAYGPFSDHDTGLKGLYWCRRIIKRLHDRDLNDFIDLLSSAMLIIQPGRRCSARACWKRALQLSPNRGVAPTQASYDASEEKLAETTSFRAQKSDSALNQGVSPDLIGPDDQGLILLYRTTYLSFRSPFRIGVIALLTTKVYLHQPRFRRDFRRTFYLLTLTRQNPHIHGKDQGRAHHPPTPQAERPSAARGQCRTIPLDL